MVIKREVNQTHLRGTDKNVQINLNERKQNINIFKRNFQVSLLILNLIDQRAHPEH